MILMGTERPADCGRPWLNCGLIVGTTGCAKGAACSALHASRKPCKNNLGSDMTRTVEQKNTAWSQKSLPCIARDNKMAMVVVMVVVIVVVMVMVMMMVSGRLEPLGVGGWVRVSSWGEREAQTQQAEV